MNGDEVVVLFRKRLITILVCIIDEEEILKTIAIFRIIMPNTSLRFAGGRIKRLSHQAQKQGIIAGVDSMIVGNLLTTIGQAPQNDLEMIQECGKTL